MAFSDKKTLKYYEQNSQQYAARQPRVEDTDALSKFMSLLPKAACVCDLGCGNGWAAAQMITNGFSVTAIDASAELATEAKKMHDLNVTVGNFDDFSYEDAFDGLWSCWTLHHTTADNFPNLLARVAKSVRPHGILFFSLKGGYSERRDEKNRIYAEFSEEELFKIVESSIHGSIISHRSWDVTDGSGRRSPRHATFIRIGACNRRSHQ